MRTTISTFIAMFKHCIGPPLIRELIRTAQFPKRWLCKKSMWLPKWQSNIKLNIYHITEKCLFYFLNIQRLPYSHCFLYSCWLFKLIPWQRKKFRLPHSLVIVASQLQLREGSLFRPLLANTKYNTFILIWKHNAAPYKLHKSKANYRNVSNRRFIIDCSVQFLLCVLTIDCLVPLNLGYNRGWG